MYAYAEKRQSSSEKVKSSAHVRPSQMKTAVSNHTGIPDSIKTRFESLSGFSFDDVQVHYNSDKPAQLQALAYTQGNQVYVAPGQEKHLGHELGHVVQQKEGRVQPTTQLQGMAINDDPAMEYNADSIGKGAVTQSMRHEDNESYPTGNFSDAIQCFYVNSYYLKREKKPDGITDKKNLSISAEFLGDYQECNDTTNKGYREAAEGVLGSRSNLSILSKHNIIMEKNSGDHSYALSHLVAAEFGGQYKYKMPPENIRYFPDALEHGAWQQKENQLKEKCRHGMLHVIGQDESLTTVFRLAESIAQHVQPMVGLTKAIEIEMALYDKLKGVKHVPLEVEFDYQELGDGESIRQSWAGLSNGLAFNQGVPPVNIFKALVELKVLTAEEVTEKIQGFSMTTNTVIRSAVDLIAYIEKVFTNAANKENAKKQVARIWGNQTIPKWQNVIAEQINKSQDMRQNGLSIIVPITEVPADSAE